jgi:hypothetical protein
LPSSSVPSVPGTKATKSKSPWRKVFIEALRDSASVLYACKVAGVARSTVYRRRKDDPKFAQAWTYAIEEAIDMLELEARSRTLKGSDVLLMFLLKAARPEMYRENVRVQHTAVPRQKIRIVNVVRPAQLDEHKDPENPPEQAFA